METNFDQKTHGQRWQVETVISMIKRNQGDCLHAGTQWAKKREMMLKVLTHNIAILLFVNELLYRAGPVPFFGPAHNVAVHAHLQAVAWNGLSGCFAYL